MYRLARRLVVLSLGALLLRPIDVDAATPARLATVEAAYLDYLDAIGAAGYIESGGAARHAGRDLAGWRALQASSRRAVEDALQRLPTTG